jgi:RNA polymerase sigma-70 factor, ECF subfamily
MDPLDRVQREELLRVAVLAGNENAWRTWYDETFDELYRYVRWRCGGRKDWADEIVQETWLTAVRRVRRFDPRKGTFLAWLRGIAANLLRNELRKRRRSPKFQQSSEGEIGKTDEGESPWEDHRREEEVAAALDALSEREEAVLRAKYLDGMSVAEIAAANGDTPKAVESLLSRARQAFRGVYRGMGTEEVVGMGKGDSPIFAETKIGTVPRQPPPSPCITGDKG